MSSSMSALDYGIIGAYMLFALGVGIFFSKKASKNTENYFLGGRSLPWWMIGISMVATSFAADTPLWTTEVVRVDGLQRIWWVLIAVMALIVGIFLFSRLWRRAEIVTDAEFFELRYEGKSAAFLRSFRAFFSGVIQNVATIGWVCLAMSSIITVMTGIETLPAMVICIAVALLYATFSGFYGVVVTDLVQFFLATISMIALGAIAVVQCGGMEHILTTIANNTNPDDTFGPRTLQIFPDFSKFNMDTVKIIIYFTIFWWSDASGYNMQRMSACRNEKDAVKATIFYAIFQTIRPWIWVIVGLVSIVVIPQLPEGYTDTQAYPLVMNKYLITGLKGILVTAFLAAFMSTIDTHLNWGASYLTVDVYKRFINKDASDKRTMLITKIFVVSLMLAGAFLSSKMTSITGAMEFMGMLMIGSGIIMVLRWFWWRINAFTELSAMIMGLVIGAMNLFMPDDTPVYDYVWGEGESAVSFATWGGIPWEFKIAVFTFVVLGISLLVTLLTKPVSTEKLEAFYRKVRPGGCWSVLDKGVRQLPGKALNAGIVLDVLGAMLMCYGLSLAIGYAILLKFVHSGICLLLAMLGILIVTKWFYKEVQRFKFQEKV